MRQTVQILSTKRGRRLKKIPKFGGRHVWKPPKEVRECIFNDLFWRQIGVKLSLSATASLPRPSLLLAVSPAMPPRMMTMRNNETPFS